MRGVAGRLSVRNSAQQPRAKIATTGAEPASGRQVVGVIQEEPARVLGEAPQHRTHTRVQQVVLTLEILRPRPFVALFVTERLCRCDIHVSFHFAVRAVHPQARGVHGVHRDVGTVCFPDEGIELRLHPIGDRKLLGKVQNAFPSLQLRKAADYGAESPERPFTVQLGDEPRIAFAHAQLHLRHHPLNRVHLLQSLLALGDTPETSAAGFCASGWRHIRVETVQAWAPRFGGDRRVPRRGGGDDINRAPDLLALVGERLKRPQSRIGEEHARVVVRRLQRGDVGERGAMGQPARFRRQTIKKDCGHARRNGRRRHAGRRRCAGGRASGLVAASRRELPDNPALHQRCGDYSLANAIL